MSEQLQNEADAEAEHNQAEAETEQEQAEAEQEQAEAEAEQSVRTSFWSWLRQTARLWGFLGFLVVIALIFRRVLLPFVLALLVTYVFAPVLRALCGLQIAGRRLPRFVWLIALYTVLLGLIALFVTLFVPRVTQDFKRIAGEAPQLIQKVKKGWLPSIEAWIEQTFNERVQPAATKKSEPPSRLRVRVLPDGRFELEASELRLEVVKSGNSRWVIQSPKTKNEENNLNKYLQTLTSGSAVKMKQVVTAGQRVIAGLLQMITTFILVLMISAFLLVDTERILAWVGTLVPKRYGADYRKMLELIDRALGGAIRGQLLICLVNGVLTGIGLVLFGVKYALLLALLAGVMSLIPIFGSILSSIPIVIVALVSGTEGVDLWRGMLILIWIIGIHLLEANFLNPKIIGTAAKIHPVIVIFAVVAGERTYGAVGALLAVPIVSAVQATFIFVRAKVRGELHLIEGGGLKKKSAEHSPEG
jgi:predicted PurR-regulated permease PerM